MPHDASLRCRCGAIEWAIATDAGTKVICHCRDCQSFARHLAAAEYVLDGAGGTHIFQTLPDRVRIKKGTDRLAALRLSPNGLIRWYAACCGTPVANTLPRAGIPFVGLILPPDADGFGKTVARAFTESARQPVRTHGMARAGAAVLWRAVVGRINGAQRTGPFYTADGAPVAPPTILTRDERAVARPG